MPSTPTYGFRYPAGTNPANVPLYMQQLAEDVESSLKKTEAKTQHATSVVTTNATGTATVPFPVAFSGIPVVVAMDGDGSASGLRVFGIYRPGLTPTGFQVEVWNLPANTYSASQSVRIDWIAVGPA